MAFSKGYSTLSVHNIRTYIGEPRIISYYLSLNKLPALIQSPLREDSKPSFGIYVNNKEEVYYKDFANNDSGNIYVLLEKLWQCSFKEVIDRISRDFYKFTDISTIVNASCNRKDTKNYNKSELFCKIREWKEHDIEYWKSYGVPVKWLKYAEVYPISHKIIKKDNRMYTFKADKYAYAFVEHKEGKTTLKIYQPFNTSGFKWCNKHDKSVISLWTKIPKKGDKVVICSSLKDALCLWANTGIPALAVQGEGFTMSKTAVEELKKRFSLVFIIFDSDEAGIEDSIKLSKDTGFINLLLPKFEGGKDISDMFKIYGKEKFLQTITQMFESELPF